MDSFMRYLHHDPYSGLAVGVPLLIVIFITFKIAFYQAENINLKEDGISEGAYDMNTNRPRTERKWKKKR